MKTEDTEDGRQRAISSKTVPRYTWPTYRTAYTVVHHCNGTRYCSTETVVLIFPFLRTNITSQMWPSRCNGAYNMQKRYQIKQVIPQTADVAPCSTAGCCHLANWMTWPKNWEFHEESCKCFPVTLTNIVTSLHYYKHKWPETKPHRLSPRQSDNGLAHKF